MICGCRVVGVPGFSHCGQRNTLSGTHNRTLRDMPVGQGCGRVVLETFQLLLNMEPLALPGQIANGLS